MYVSVLDTPFFKEIVINNPIHVQTFFQKRTLSKHQVLFYQNDIADEMYIIKTGSLQIYRQDEDRIIVLGHQFSGQTIGELEAVHHEKKRLASVSALENTTLWMIKTKQLDELIDMYPIILRRMFYVVSDRLAQADRKIEYLAFLDVRIRIANLLLDLYANFGKSQSEGTLIDWKVPQQHLANMVGIGRESATKALGELQQDGIIHIEKRMITIIDFKKLFELAGGIGTSEDRRWHSYYTYRTPDNI
ncbi:Crp/Fnr family transcriptional regulator [Paenibacillus sp. WLX1005]|uniref:Crp/Fnr family transcriptional regulator n=1 Tax=Paenibacillus sp. WLX1005 TaxID=3243766 RepID=UPI003983E32F